MGPKRDKEKATKSRKRVTPKASPEEKKKEPEKKKEKGMEKEMMGETVAAMAGLSVASEPMTVPLEPEGAVGGDAAPSALRASPESPQRTGEEERSVRPKERAESPLVQRQLVARPGLGTTYVKLINLITNHYRLNLSPSKSKVYHYDIEILEVREQRQGDRRPKMLDRKRCSEVIDELVKSNNKPGKLFYNSTKSVALKAVFDGVKNLYTVLPLGLIGTEAGSTVRVNVTMQIDNCDNELRQYYGIDIKSKKKEATYEVSIKVPGAEGMMRKSCEIDLSVIGTYQTVGRLLEVPQDAIQALNIIMKYGPAIERISIGQNSLYPRNGQRTNLFRGAHLGIGHFQSVRPSAAGLTLVVNRTATIFYPKGSVFNYIKELLNLRSEDDISPGLLRQQSMTLEVALKKLHFEAYHMGHKMVYKKFYKITEKSANELSFGEGSEKQTVAQYFKKKYQLTLQWPNFPCLDFGSEAKHTYLPIEVCFLKPDQSLRGKPSPQQTQTMIRETAVRPGVRFADNDRSVAAIQMEGKITMSEFGVGLTNEPLEAPGKVIREPKLKYGNGQVITPTGGSWNMERKQVFKAIPRLTHWVVAAFTGSNNDVVDFVMALIRRAKDLGVDMDIPTCPPLTCRDFRNRNAMKDMFLEALKYKPQLILCVGSKTDTQMYSELKQMGDTVVEGVGVLSQYIDIDNAKKKSSQSLANIVLKINSKLGGINQILAEKPPSLLPGKGVMILGADVTHPGQGDQADAAASSKTIRVEVSVAALVASMDSEYVQYYTAVRVQHKEKEEMITQIDDMFRECAAAYCDANGGKLPKHIIYYRDGVSEGQFQTVLVKEVDKLINVWRELAEARKQQFKENLTLVVVQKRHQTRMRPKNEKDGVGKMGNVPPGTCVDQVIVHPVHFDFFLCSHEGIQGTSKPAHYCVLRDDNKYQPDELYKVSFYLCHTYVKCTRSISIPAPVMYSHLAAERARYHIVGNPKARFAEPKFPVNASKERLEELVIEEQKRRIRFLNNAVQVVPKLRQQLYFC